MADVVALHGFTQRGAMWSEVAGLVGGIWEMPDLPGHGDEPAVDWDRAVQGVCRLLEASGPETLLVGYSLGGRLALASALVTPDLGGLVLVSASPGIEGAEARERRRIEDDHLAGRVERVGVEVFVDEWLSLDLFSGLGRRPAAWGRSDRRMRVTNTAAGLAGSLRLLGQGSQPYLGNRIGDLAMPVVAVAGEIDDRYVSMAARFGDRSPRGRTRVVAGVGHAVVAEAPGAVAEAIGSLLPR